MNEFNDLFKEYYFLKLEQESYIEFSEIAHLTITVKLSAELMYKMTNTYYDRNDVTEKIKKLYKNKNEKIRKVNITFKEID